MASAWRGLFRLYGCTVLSQPSTRFRSFVLYTTDRVYLDRSEQSPCKYFRPGQIARSLKFLFLQGRFLTVALCAGSGAASQLLLDPAGFVRLN